MRAPKNLPRVTYSNVGADFAPLHAWLDKAIPKFRKEALGQTWPNVIGGKPDTDGKVYSIASPIDRNLLVAKAHAVGKRTVRRAIAAARDAFPAWSAVPWQERVEAMRRFAAELDRRKYELAMAALYEVGKSRLEAVGEAEEAVDLITYYCDEMERNEGFVRAMQRAVPREETRVALRSIGAFAVIAPFNFPIALPCNMLGACLVAGNTAVFKPSPGAAMTGGLLLEAAQAAGLPPGVLNLVNGEKAGRHLVAAKGVDGIAFTGSHQVGMEIFRSVAQGAIARPVICEMGGKNPAYVTASADLDAAAEGLVRSAFGLQGEKCSACSVAYVERAVCDDLLKRLQAKAERLAVGTPEAAATFVGPVIDKRAVKRFEKAVAAAARAGRVVAGGRRVRTGALANGHFVAPTIVADLPEDHWLNREEQFLPLLSVQPCDSLEDGIAKGNRVDYGLTAGIYAEDPAALDTFFRTTQAGVLYANRRSGATTGAWPGFQTFCGWKGSGVDGKGGLGPWAIPRYMREQSLTIMHPEAKPR